MVRPQQIIDGMIRSVKGTGDMPSEMAYLPYEASRTGANGNVKLPLLEVQPVDKIDVQDFNTDRVSFVTDEDGNRIGRRFQSEYRLRIQFDLYTAEGSSYDARALGNKLYRALYRHDSHGPNIPLPAEDGGELALTWRFNVEDSEPAHELETTPSLRRWRIDTVVWSVMEIDTTEDYVTDFNLPAEFVN